MKHEYFSPIADHKGEQPTVLCDRGPDGIKVKLERWTPNDPNIWPSLLAQADASYGNMIHPNKATLDDGDRERIAKMFTGAMLPQILEQFQFSFRVEGVSLNCTHQIVRTRIGASFLQQSMRNNDGRHMQFTIPEAIARVINDEPGKRAWDAGNFNSLFEKYCRVFNVDYFLPPHGVPKEVAREILEDSLKIQKAVYAALLDSGVHFQDARRYLASGHQSYLWCNYNWPALKGVVSNRTEHIVMDWEIDCVAQLMMREVWRNCPWFMAHGLGSASDSRGKEAYAEVADWPSCQKWPGPTRERKPLFSNEQCPFWVLSPESLVKDGPPVWIKTDGVFPHKIWCQIAKDFVPNHPWLKKFIEQGVA